MPGPRPRPTFDELLADPALAERFKASVIRRALENNAALPPEQRRPEWAVREHEHACFDLIGI